MLEALLQVIFRCDNLDIFGYRRQGSRHQVLGLCGDTLVGVKGG